MKFLLNLKYSILKLGMWLSYNLYKLSVERKDISNLKLKVKNIKYNTEKESQSRNIERIYYYKSEEGLKNHKY